MNIQWKNTSICMDFTCPHCHAENHYDGYFHHIIECGKCKAQFEMPTEIPLRVITPESPASYSGWTAKQPSFWDEP